MGELGARGSLGHLYIASLYSLTLPPSRAPHASRSRAAAHLSGPDLRAAEVLVRSGLHRASALRHGNGRGYIPRGDLPARRGTGTLECRLRAAFAPSHGWALWRQSVSTAALLSVSSLHQTLP